MWCACGRMAPDPKAAPGDVAVMAATTTDRRQFDEAWAFERKLDGFRVLAWADGDGVRLRSRNGQVYDDTFAEVTAALGARAKGSLLVDGEVVVFEDGQTSFS